MGQTRILLVEDAPKVAGIVAETLMSSGHDVEWCEDSEEGMRRLRSRLYDLVIVDIELPGMDGLELVSWLREAGNLRPIMLLTARGTTKDIVLGLERGADDYMTKPFDPSELRARVDALMRRGAEDDVHVLRYGDLCVDQLRGRAWRAGRLLNLSPKELELLAYFVGRPETTLKSADLLRDVWNVDSDSDTTVLRVTLSRLRRKLCEPGEPGLIVAQRGVGFFLGRVQAELEDDVSLVVHGSCA